MEQVKGEPEDDEPAAEAGRARLYVDRSRHGDRTVVTLVGVLVEATVPQVRTALLPALTPDEPSLVVDLRDVDRLDEVGLDALRRTGARATALGGGVLLVLRPGRVHDDVLEIAGEPGLRLSASIPGAPSDPYPGETSTGRPVST